MYAIIVDGKVVQVSAQEPSEGAMFMECGAEVRPGWRVDGGACVVPAPGPQPDPNADIDARIAELEAGQHRATRELLLVADASVQAEAKARLTETDALITALRAQRV